MSPHEKKGNKGCLHHPIHTSLFVVCLCKHTFSYKKVSIVSKINRYITRKKQRCRDGVMNEFLFWCRHPLVPLLFHEVTSLHPPSFQKNNYSTFSTISVWGQAPIKMRREDIAN